MKQTSQIVVGFSYVQYNDRRRIIAQDNALRVLANHPQGIFPVAFNFRYSESVDILNSLNIPQLNILKRDSSVEIKNDRKLPYIKEILEYCYRIKCDIFGYINSDILIPTDVYDILKQDFDAYIFSRFDIGEISPEEFLDNKYKVIYGGDTHAGVDGFFFNKSWWKINRNKFPDDLIIGASEWDTCYRYIIKNSVAKYFESRRLYHVFHDQTWRLDTPDAVNNIKIWNELKNKKGVVDTLI